MKYALFASWDSKWINDHKKWLSIYGEHSDGWSNRIKQANIELLKGVEKSQGYLWFYTYMPKSKGGDMKVHHRVKIKNLNYTKEPIQFDHISGSVKLKHHDTPLNYAARLTFNIVAIEDIPPRDPKEFITSNGEYIKGGSQLLSILVVEENG